MPELLPTVKLGEVDVTRLIIGGNQISGFSHRSREKDLEMMRYYTTENVLKLWDAAWRNGINTIQTRGDRHTSRIYLEHRQRGGSLQWIAQTASEWRDLAANAAYLARFEPIAIYNHGTYTDHLWHHGKIDEVADIVKAIKDQGLPAGVGSHMPEVIDYAENAGWQADFYMTCFYNLSRTEKRFVATDSDPYSQEEYRDGDPDLMTAVMRQIDKPCLGYKILAAGRKAETPENIRAAFQYAFDSIKPSDAVVVGIFPKEGDQIAQNAAIVKGLLAP